MDVILAILNSTAFNLGVLLGLVLFFLVIVLAVFGQTLVGIKSIIKWFNQASWKEVWIEARKVLLIVIPLGILLFL